MSYHKDMKNTEDTQNHERQIIMHSGARVPEVWCPRFEWSLAFLEKTFVGLGVIVSSCCPFNKQHEDTKDTKKMGTKALIAAQVNPRAIDRLRSLGGTFNRGHQTSAGPGVLASRRRLGLKSPAKFIGDRRLGLTTNRVFFFVFAADCVTVLYLLASYSLLKGSYLVAL